MKSEDGAWDTTSPHANLNVVSSGLQAVPAQPANTSMTTSPDKASPVSMPPKRTCILVLGMHRSGTSSIAGTLVNLGVTAPKTLLGANGGNLAGHWESGPLIAFHDELLASAGSSWDDWRALDPTWYDGSAAQRFKQQGKALLNQEFGDSALFVFKDPRICRITRFWLDIFAELAIEPKIIQPIRSPLEVARSLGARDGFKLSKGLLLWLRHVLDAEAASRSLARVTIDWESFLNDWRPHIEAFESAFGRMPLDAGVAADQIDSFLRHDLKHQHAGQAELDRDVVSAWVQKVYAAVTQLTHSPSSPDSYATLDRIRAEFQDASALFAGLMADAEAARSEAKTSSKQAEQARAEAAAHLAATQQERSERGAEMERLFGLAISTMASYNQDHPQLLAKLQENSALEAKALSVEEHMTDLARTLETARDEGNQAVVNLEKSLNDIRSELQKIDINMKSRGICRNIASIKAKISGILSRR